MNSVQDLLPAETAMGTVTLKVGDLGRMAGYYRSALGLVDLAESTEGLYLGRPNTPLIRLVPAGGLKLPARTEAGLFHTAILFADRADLAATVATAAQTAQAGKGHYVGSADHLVSEAFYFTDPEGNGIELYFDKPRETWNWTTSNGHRSVMMDNVPLPPQQYLTANLTEDSMRNQEEAPAGVGHVHLQVGDVETAENFYVSTLGFERTAGWHGQALFVAAGGYHHHMAMNVWNSRGAGPRRDTLGLGEVLLHVPTADEADALAERLDAAGVGYHHTGAELRFSDPWNNKLRVAVG
ncbi:VOC family protein [Arthrobacter tecti]